MLQTVREGGIPFEKSKGFAISSKTLFSRFFSPANFNALNDPTPFVAFTIKSPKAVVHRSCNFNIIIIFMPF